MKHAWKKGLSLLLALLLVMQLFPMAATAQGSGAAPIAVDAAGENTELLTTPLDGAGDVQIDPNAEVTFLVELETALCFCYIAVALYLGRTPSTPALFLWIAALVLSIYFPCRSAARAA